MAPDDLKPPGDNSSELVKFKRLAMRVVSVPKDAVSVLDPKLKLKAKRKATKKQAKKRSIDK